MSDRKEFRDLATPERAHEAIAALALGTNTGTETVPLSEARGRVLAERIDATLDVPGFDRASMDGYAVRARDTFGADEANPARLELAGEVHAGEEPSVTVDEGEAVEISTGAVMPQGADAVVMVERTDLDEAGTQEQEQKQAQTQAQVLVRTSVAPGDHVMLAGADVAAGERAMGPGTRLTPREIGLLSALGIDEVPVRGNPTVGIISTGDELVRPGGDLHSAAGQIYDVNSYTIAAGVEEAGGVAVLYPHAGDDYDEMERILTEAASECDLVLSSGSTSASAVDVIYRVIEEQGELLMHGVAVKPGKPMLIGRLANSAYVGLPGYPVSALTIFRTFVAPAIREAAGQPEPQTATITGQMAVEERYAEGRLRLLPVGLVTDGDGRTLVYPVDKGSGATTSLVEADGTVAVDPDTEYLAADETVEVQLFSPDVRPLSVFGVGEDDPALSRLLDRLDTPRYLSLGTREGLRRFRNGVPDVTVVAGFDEVTAETEADADVNMATDADVDTNTDTDTDTNADVDANPSANSGVNSGIDIDIDIDMQTDYELLGGWTREWGLLVPAGNPADVTGLADLIDRDLRLVNRGTNSGLRTALDDAIADIAATRDRSRRGITDDIDGYELTAKAHESPARKVIAGDADVGLGLRATATADTLGSKLDCISLGTQPVHVLANADRMEKAGVMELADVLANLDTDADGDSILSDLTGYAAIDNTNT